MSQKLKLYLLLAFSLLLFLHPIDSGDFFHHIVTGRYIFQNWRLPYTDTFTFTAFSQPWIAHSWASGVLYYLVHQLLGTTGNTLLIALFGLLTTTVLYQLAKSYTPVTSAVLSFIWLTAAFMSLYWPSRPLVLGPLFLATLILLLKYIKKLYFILPLFFFTWSIFYGASVLLGLVILIGFFITIPAHRTTKIIVTFILCLIASLLNGYGLHSLFYSLTPGTYVHSQEWLPIYRLIGLPLLSTAKYQLAAYFVIICIVLLALNTAYRRPRKLLHQYPFEFLLALGIFTPLISFRFLSLVPIFPFPLILLVLNSSAAKTKITNARLLFALALLVTFSRFAFFPFGFGIKNQQSLQDLTAFLQQQQIHGNIYVSQDLGGYINWVLPDSKVFVDTRDDLFQRTKVFSDIDALYSGRLTISQLLDSYHAEVVIGRPSQTFKSLLSDINWEFLYKSDYFVAVRKK